MDQPISLQSDVVANDNNVDTNTNDSHFLRQLNSNCQLEVLQYLNVNDLLQITKFGNYFAELISKWIIGNKLVNVKFEDLCGSTAILTVFGKSIRKLKVNGNDYNLMLERIVSSCTPNKMTEIEFVVGYATNSSDENVEHSLPLFTNLQKLRFDNKFDVKNDFVDHLNEFASSALNLKVLRVRCYNIQGDWLRTKYMRNLCEFRVHTLTNISLDDLKYFIREHPKLQVFTFSGLSDVTVIGSCLAKYCKNLRKIHLKDTVQRVGDINENEFKIETDDNVSKPYGFLSSFPNLNNFTLTSCSYRKCAFISLISHYNVREVKISVNLNDFFDQCKLKYSGDSETMEIDIRKDSMEKEKREPCQTSFQIIVDIVSRLRNVEKISLCSGRRLSNLHQLFDVTPNIRTLSISNVSFLHLPVEIRKLVRILRKTGEEKKYRKIVHLVLNEAQWRELDIYELEGIVSASIDRQQSRKRFKMCHMW